MLVFGQIWKTRFTLDSKSLGQRAIYDWHVSKVTLITHPTTEHIVTLGIEQQFNGLKVHLGWCSVYFWLACVCADFVGL